MAIAGTFVIVWLIVFAQHIPVAILMSPLLTFVAFVVGAAHEEDSLSVQF